MYSDAMSRRVAALALGLLAVTAAPVAAQTTAPPAARSAPAGAALDETVRSLEAAYAKVNDLKAEFDQTAFNKSLNQSIPAKGTVYLKKGGKLRWMFADPTPRRSSPTARRSGSTRRH
jgi:outer membrane lipoprotein-sorting protein